MSRILLVSLSLLVGLPTLADASMSAVSKSMGDLRWGMSEYEVQRFLKRKIKEDARKARGMAKRALERAAGQIDDGLVQFNGRSRYDRGPIADQFTHGNQESMLVYEDGESKNYYFFIQGRLWKWVKAYPSRAFGGSNFKRFEKLVGKKFGRGHVKTEELYRGTGDELRFIEFRTRNTRLRAVDKTGDHGQYALVFEDMGTVRDLSALRTNVDRRQRARDRATARRSAAPKKSAPRATPSKFKNVVDDDNSDETRAEYLARRKRVVAAEKAKQRAIHERRSDRKKGKALDALAGIEDDDPLSGF